MHKAAQLCHASGNCSYVEDKKRRLTQEATLKLARARQEDTKRDATHGEGNYSKPGHRPRNGPQKKAP